jgi:hypothetical protein
LVRASPDIHVTDDCEIAVRTRAKVVYVEGVAWQSDGQLIRNHEHVAIVSIHQEPSLTRYPAGDCRCRKVAREIDFRRHLFADFGKDLTAEFPGAESSRIHQVSAALGRLPGLRRRLAIRQFATRVSLWEDGLPVTRRHQHRQSGNGDGASHIAVHIYDF